jgi:enoyl-CoA hydratase
MSERSSSDDAEITVTADGPVRIVTLNRPNDLNAFTRTMHRAITDVWRRIAADEQARAVILTGAGRAFSAGGDFDWMDRTHREPAQAAAAVDEAGELIQEMLRFPLPVIAAVNGPAVGLGCSLTILSDLVVMADSAHLADPHVSIGLVAGDGGALWPLATGLHRAKEFLFLGTRLGAADAVAFGLANRAVPAEDVLAQALEWAHALAVKPAAALRDTKAALNTYAATLIGPAIRVGLVGERASMGSAEHGERLAQLRPR